MDESYDLVIIGAGSTEPSRRGLVELLGDLDLNEGKRLAHRGVELIEGGVVGYTLVAART
jgi:hypothetical protein